MRFWSAAPFLLVGLYIAGSASALTVTLNPGTFSTSLTVDVREGVGPVVANTLTPTSLPYPDTDQVTSGVNVSESIYDLTNAALEVSFDHTRATSIGSFAQSFGTIEFGVDVPVDYVLSGGYVTSDIDGRETKLRVQLIDRSVALLFDNIQESHATPNEAFTVGLEGGDFSNALVGSLTGTLIPGHEYVLLYNFSIKADAAASQAAGATGNVQLQFVPEPGTGILLAGPFGWLIWRQRRRPQLG